MKLLILIIALYLGYRILRSWTRPGDRRNRSIFHGGNRQIDDVMVKDPVCEVYIPQKEGIHLREEGKDLYFCSSECKEKFLENRKRN